MSGWTPPRDRAGTRERRRIGLPVPRDGRCAVTRPPAGNAGRRAGLTRARPATAPTASGPPAAKWTASVARVWVRLDPESAGSTVAETAARPRWTPKRPPAAAAVMWAAHGRVHDSQDVSRGIASRVDSTVAFLKSSRARLLAPSARPRAATGENRRQWERHGRRRVRQRRCARRSGSLNRISKCFCVFANPSVPCHDHDQRRWLVNKLRCRQVHGVERANWLDRKRSTDASENCVCDSYYVTAKLKTPERAHCRLLFVGRQPRRCTRSKNRPCGFGNRQCGGDLPPSGADRFECV